jgi:hypothetical protein
VKLFIGREHVVIPSHAVLYNLMKNIAIPAIQSSNYPTAAAAVYSWNITLQHP